MQQMLLKEINKIGGKRAFEEQHEKSPNHNTSSSSMDRPPGFPAKPSLDPIKESMDEFKLSFKKVELHGFPGVDPAGWIARAETYFEVHNIEDVMKVKLAQLCMEGSTIHWFNLWRESEEDPSWKTLKQALMLRSSGTRYDNPFEALKIPHQVGSVEDYIETFEFVSS